VTGITVAAWRVGKNPRVLGNHVQPKTRSILMANSDTGLREFTLGEIDEVNGGLGPIGSAVAFIIGAALVIGGIIGATVYGASQVGDYPQTPKNVG
jgi:lactobin A/cerein 7B family class IIb bacteriocin